MKDMKNRFVGLILAYQVIVVPKETITSQVATISGEKMEITAVKKEKAPPKKMVKPAKPKENVKLDRMLEKQEAFLKTALSKLEASRGIQRKLQGSRIKSMTRFRGQILNSVVASNSIAETFIVRVTDESEFKNAELKCSGIAYEKRLKSRCDLMVHGEEEFRVDALVWDKDGAMGPMSDHWYTSEEKEFLSMGMARFLEGAANFSQSRTMTNFGSVANVTQGNQLLNGVAQMGQSAGRKFEEASNKRVEIAMVEAGKEVIVFFNQGVASKEENHHE